VENLEDDAEEELIIKLIYDCDASGIDIDNISQRNQIN